MNSEQGTTPAPAAERTSGLAIASLILGLLGCLCLPGIAGIVCGIIALVQIGKTPGLKGKGLAIGGIVAAVVTGGLIPILSAIAIPNFIMFQTRAKQAECKTNLVAIASAARAHYGETNAFTEDFSELGFDFGPQAQSNALTTGRYAYVISAAPELGTSMAIGLQSALPEERVREEAGRELAGELRAGVEGECPDCSFTAMCIGNPDTDPELDIWSISTADRVGPRGSIPAMTPFAESDDTQRR